VCNLPKKEKKRLDEEHTFEILGSNFIYHILVSNLIESAVSTSGYIEFQAFLVFLQHKIFLFADLVSFLLDSNC
jgi:hypothetical protein